jgi:hypothetical protein
MDYSTPATDRSIKPTKSLDHQGWKNSTWNVEYEYRAILDFIIPDMFDVVAL